MFAASGLMAQEFAYEFAQPDGTIVPDGSVVTINKAVVADDGSGDMLMDAGLYVKNVDGDNDDLLRIAYDVSTMENGMMTICFPSACASVMMPGSGTTNPGKLDNQLHSISTEWFPTDYGKCTAKVALQTVVKTTTGYLVIDDGPSVTLQFVYANPSGVSSAISVARPVAYYSISGQRLTGRPHGMVLVRLSDGRVVKRIIR